MTKSEIVELMKDLNKNEVKSIRDYFAREMAFSGMQDQNVRHTLANLVKGFDSLAFYIDKHDVDLQCAIECEAE